MKNQKLKKLLLRSTLLAVMSASPAGVALAQTAPAPAAADTQDVIVVTGTRIAKEDYVSSSPVMTVGAEQFQRQQPVDMEDVMRTMPQFLPGNGAQVNNGSAGVSTLDLRGLSTPRTLPLIDGKRMVGFDTNGLFDISAVPIALLDRVEVVTGGASAVYGSDAVAGVVNFILNDEFQGVQVDASLTNNQSNSAEIENYAITMGAGFDGGRGNVSLSLNYAEKEASYQNRAPGSATPGASSTADPAGIDSAVGGRTQFTSTGDLVPFYLGFDFNPQNLYQTPQTRWGATALGKYEFNEHLEAYTRFIYNNSVSAPQLASSGTFGFSFEVPLTNPFLSSQASTYLAANNPVAACSDASLGSCVDVGIRWRAVPVGPRQYRFAYDTFQSLVGLRGDFMGWDWDIAAAHGETSLQRQQNNDIDSVKFQQALFASSTTTCSDPSNLCSPINIFNPSIPVTAAAAAFVSLNLQVQSITKQDYVTAYASRELDGIKTPWASTPVAVSIGAEYRMESSDYRPDAASMSGVSPGFGQTLPTSGEYDVNEVFGEAIVPLVSDMPFAKSINLELGYRTSDYSTSGRVESYKYGADWAPIDGLRFRGMFQRAVRAANISELFSPVTPGTGDLLVDPCANGAPGTPLTGALAALCIATGVPSGAIAGGTLAQPTSGQVNSFFGGSSTVTPEEADTKTFGFVWQPDFVRGLSMTVDYYDIEVNNAISVRPNYDIVDACYNPTRNLTMSATNADCLLIARNTTNGTIEGDLIYGIQQVTGNIGQVHVEGVDYSFNYGLDIGALGNLEFTLDGTHVLDTSYKPSDNAPVVDCLGHYGKQCGLPSSVSGSTGGPTPEDYFVQATTWKFGKFDLGYAWRYIAGSTVDPSQAADTGPESSSIPDFNYFDIFGSWQVTDWAKLKVGVRNVTDEEAPFVATETGSTNFNSGNTYPSTYNPLGRIWTVGVTTRF